MGWSIVRDGNGSRLYDLGTQKEYELRLGYMVPTVEVAPYLNPPYSVLPFLPLSFLSRVNAARVWLCLQLVFLFLTLKNLWAVTEHWRKSERVYMVSAILASTMLVYTLYQGAFSLLILMAITFLYRAKRDGHKTGIWLVVGAIKPQLMVLPGVILIARRWWRTIIAAFSLLLLLVVVSFPFVGVQSYVKYVELLKIVGSEFGNRYGAPPDTMSNFKALLSNFSTNAELINLTVYIVLVAAILFVIYLWRSEEAFNLRFAFTILLGLFVAPHLNDQDVLVAALPTVLLYDHVRTKPRQQIFAVLLCCLPAVLAISRAQDKRAILVLLILLLTWSAAELLLSMGPHNQPGDRLPMKV